jgi:hypothetical protein
MRRVTYLVAIVGLLGGSAAGQGERHGADRAELSALEGIRATERLGRLPIGFVENRGQWDARARFAARIEAMTVFLEERGWTLALEERNDVAERIRGVAIRLTFEGEGASALAGEGLLPGRHHTFLGRDPGNWRADVPRFRSVRFPSLRPGVDVRARDRLVLRVEHPARDPAAAGRFLRGRARGGLRGRRGRRKARRGRSDEGLRGLDGRRDRLRRGDRCRRRRFALRFPSPARKHRDRRGKRRERQRPREDAAAHRELSVSGPVAG